MTAGARCAADEVRIAVRAIVMTAARPVEAPAAPPLVALLVTAPPVATLLAKATLLLALPYASGIVCDRDGWCGAGAC